MEVLAGLSAAVHELKRTSDDVCCLLSSTSAPCTDVATSTAQQTCAAGSNTVGSPPGTAVLTKQLRQLTEDKQRIQQDRDKLASEQGLHKGRIAQLEGSVAANEKRIKLLLEELSVSKEHCSCLSAQLQQAEQQLDVTPLRCKTAARQLQDEADRAWGRARTQEVQVKKLRQLVQHEAQEMSELVEFTEAERQMLVEQQGRLEERLHQALAAGAASEAQAQQLQAQLASSQEEVARLTQQLEQAGTDQQQLEEQLQQAIVALEAAAAGRERAQQEQQAAAAEVSRAQQEAAAAHEQAKTIFRQVRFISHVLDKNAAMLVKVPELQGLSREVRALVASHATTTAASSCGPDQGSGPSSTGAGEDCRSLAAAPAALAAAVSATGGQGHAVVGLDRCAGSGMPGAQHQPTATW